MIWVKLRTQTDQTISNLCNPLKIRIKTSAPNEAVTVLRFSRWKIIQILQPWSTQNQSTRHLVSCHIIPRVRLEKIGPFSASCINQFIHHCLRDSPPIPYNPWIRRKTRYHYNGLKNHWIFFFKKGHPRPLFVYFRSFSNKHQYNFITN